MSDRRYIRKAPGLSWHVIKTMTRGGNWLVLCGRMIPGSETDTNELPAAKSCELCLRIVARQDEFR